MTVFCALFFVLAFLSVGYATLSDTLNVTSRVFTGVEPWLYVATAEISSGDVGYRGGNSSLTEPAGILSLTADFSEGDTVTVTVTVRNNTDLNFVFKSVTAPTVEGTDTNTGLAVEGVSGITAEEALASGAVTSDITVTLKATDTGASLVSATLMFNFGFASEEDKDEAVVNKASESFLTALNDPDVLVDIQDAMSSNAGGYKFGGDYVGNVAGDTSSSDTTLIKSVFGDTLKNVSLNGTVANECTVMIKEKDVFDYNGAADVNEMVMYMTPDTITGTTGFFGSDSSVTVTVYAIVYVKDSDGKWAQYGDMYKGKANTNSYYATFSSGVACDSFNTETWVHDADAYYPDANGYLVSKGATIEEAVSAYSAYATEQ